MKNQLTPLTVLLLVCYMIVTVLSAFFDKAFLEFALPITLLVIIMNYYHESKNVNYFFIISIISSMMLDYFIYTDLIDNFSIACIATFSYLITSCLALKDYFFQIKLQWTKLISVPLLISLALVIFLVISISDFVLYLVPNATPYIIIAVVPLLMYVTISYYIFVSDRYNTGIKLLFAACLCIVTVALCPINELFYPSPVFTILVTTAHILGFYLFMQFLTKTAPAADLIPETPKYI